MKRKTANDINYGEMIHLCYFVMHFSPLYYRQHVGGFKSK